MEVIVVTLIPIDRTVLAHCRSLASLIQRSGMRLSGADAIRLMEAHHCALESTGRIEFDGGTLEALIDAFADSPWIDRAELPQVLCDLTELFYHLKNETNDRIPDEILIELMRQRFDSPCRGSVQMLTDLLGRGLQ